MTEIESFDFMTVLQFGFTAAQLVRERELSPG
jgi:hypothetical protein